MDFEQYIPIPISDVVSGDNCILTATYNITKQSKCNLSEVDLFILANGFNIKYYYDLCNIGKLSGDFFSNLEKATSIHINLHRKDYEGITSEDMARVLAGGKAILLLVDTKNLQYSSIYSNNDNRQHVIILNGLSLSRSCAHIIDPHLTDYSGNPSVYAGVIPIEEVMAATYAYAWFDFDNRKKFTKTRIWEIAQKEFDSFLRGFKEEEYAEGLAAIRCFVNDLFRLESLDDNSLVAVCKDINYSIKVKSINYINRYMIDIINEIREDRGQNYSKLAESIRDHTTSWEKFGLSILRVGISKRRGALSDIQEKAIALFESQRRVYSEFANCLSEIRFEGGNEKNKERS